MREPGFFEGKCFAFISGGSSSVVGEKSSMRVLLAWEYGFEASIKISGSLI